MSSAQRGWIWEGATTGVIVATAGVQALFFLALSSVFMKLTQPSVEGTQYAIYTAMTNAAEVIGLALLGPLTSVLSPQMS